ncbi:MAG TPA: GNAT family N-acetyltransferase [Bacteroidales bacterium]|nr:GNAT family N-acetyltransferase [Bacteroidales bacterium]
MEIRKFTSNDIQPLVELWYLVSVEAHHFISPLLWESHKKDMAEKHLPQSETYIAVRNNEIVGFISMVNNYLAALFVKNDWQGKGIGTALLNFIKKKRKNIELKVFKKNSKSVNFYKQSGFTIIAEEVEENTHETELVMVWNQ